MGQMLYDQSREYFLIACTTDGKFDPMKALACGYSEAQLPTIKAFVEGEDVGVPEPEPEEDEIGG